MHNISYRNKSVHKALKICALFVNFENNLCTFDEKKLKSVLVKNLAQFRTGVHECAHESAQTSDVSKTIACVCTLCTLVYSWALLIEIVFVMIEIVHKLARALCAHCMQPLFKYVTLCTLRAASALAYFNYADGMLKN